MANRDSKSSRSFMSDNEITGGGGDDNQPFSPDSNPVDLLESDLRKLQSERDTLFEQLARVQADFKNAQKRLERSEEHTSELQSRFDLVCRLLLEKKKKTTHQCRP